jgi:hypothetical protein
MSFRVGSESFVLYLSLRVPLRSLLDRKVWPSQILLIGVDRAGREISRSAGHDR